MMFRAFVKSSWSCRPSPTRGCVLSCSQVSAELNSEAAGDKSKLCVQALEILGALKTKLGCLNLFADLLRKMSKISLSKQRLISNVL